MKAQAAEPCYVFDEEGRIYGVSLREYREWWERHKDEVIIASTKTGEATVTTFWAHRDLRGKWHTGILTVAPGLRIAVLSGPDTPFVGAAAGPAVWCTVVHDEDAQRLFVAGAAYAAREDALKGHEETARSTPAVRREGPAQLTHDSIHEYLGSLGLRNEAGDRYRCRLCIAPPCAKTRTAGHDWEPLDELAAFACARCGWESRPDV